MRFLVRATIKPGTAKADVVSRLPAANAVDQKRLDDGVQEHRALVAADRSAGWIVLNVENEQELEKLYQEMPLNDFQDYEAIHILDEKDN
ncbi:muconolactone Delta-isomerase family protein [Ruegeria hyattellae]|uniref:muconolactone Delta-isomerase family protein n=1 Tax=Ruegeria hyattellae TaxID=3233337 RepID=UPI00355BBBC4